MFGGAVDKAIEALCKGDTGYINVFEEAWTYPEINGQQVLLPKSGLVRYSKADLDEELIAHLPKDTGLHPSWLSLREKGLLMLEAFKNEVLPKIKVLGTQLEVALDNGHDRIIGFCDLVATYPGYNQPIVFDVKTSSIPYKDESVSGSPQLSLYLHDLSDQFNDTNLAGYIVLHKKVVKDRTHTCTKCGSVQKNTRLKSCNAPIKGKRCDGQFVTTTNFGIKIQVLVDEVPEFTTDQTINNFDRVNEDIHEGHFYKNQSACMGKFGPCEFVKFCWNEKDMTGLVRVPEKTNGK